MRTNTPEDIELAAGFFLRVPDEFLLSARSTYAMNSREFEEAEKANRYLVRKDALPRSSSLDDRQKYLGVFQNGLVAFQIIKPIQTLGFIFQGVEIDGPAFSLETTYHRQPMAAGEWARMRAFDQEFLDRVPAMIKRVQQEMAENSAERKNAIILLQLALEQNHPLIGGLLSVIGMEAILDSENRNEFKDKLCDCLGPKTLAFPDWNWPTPTPTHTVEEVAIPVYMLRNKLAHGVDLRKAALDKTTPVDLTKMVELVDFLEPRAHAYLLSEAACYLLCQLLQNVIY